MKLGVHMVRFDLPDGPTATARTLAEAGRAADDVGIDSVSLMDHYLQLDMLGGTRQPMLEGYTTLGFLAGQTDRVRLHLMVTGVTYRHPGLLAKIVSTLDVLSGGRAALGLGAAWYEHEHTALGVPFPPAAERLDRLDETLRIIKQMWSDDDGPFDGVHYQLAETINSPQPVQRPHPPVMVGGGGERRTLRIVARHADTWNVAFRPDWIDDYRRKLDVLADHCAAEQRDPSTVEKSLMWVGAPPTDPATADAFVESMRTMAALGVTDVHVMPPGPDPAGFITGLASAVLPALAEL